jgi:hypothetical protein
MASLECAASVPSAVTPLSTSTCVGPPCALTDCKTSVSLEQEPTVDVMPSSTVAGPAALPSAIAGAASAQVWGPWAGPVATCCAARGAVVFLFVGRATVVFPAVVCSTGVAAWPPDCAGCLTVLSAATAISTAISTRASVASCSLAESAGTPGSAGCCMMHDA